MEGRECSEDTQVLLRWKEAANTAGGQAGEGSSTYSGLQPTRLSAMTKSTSKKENRAAQGSPCGQGPCPKGKKGGWGHRKDTDTQGPPGPSSSSGQGGRKPRVIRVTAGQPGREECGD